MEDDTYTTRERMVCVKLEGDIASRLKFHALVKSRREGNGHVSCTEIVEDLIMAHIPDWFLEREPSGLMAAIPCPTDVPTESATAKPQRRRDGKDQTDRKHGRARS
jgi:hypothetical protein